MHISPRRIAKQVLPDSVYVTIRKILADVLQTPEAAFLKQLAREAKCAHWIIDIGANDGITASNSLPFVKGGWRALLIEPAPKVFAKLAACHETRENVTCLQLACCDKSGSQELYFGSDGEDGFLSTLCESDNEWFRGARTVNSVKVRTETITNILRMHSAPRNPGILLIDAEGMDYEVLQGLDFEQFRPAIIVTEEYEWESKKHAAKYSLLICAGYSLVQKINCNTFWIDRQLTLSRVPVG